MKALYWWRAWGGRVAHAIDGVVDLKGAVALCGYDPFWGWFYPTPGRNEARCLKCVRLREEDDDGEI